MLDPEALAALSELLGDDPAALAELVEAFVEEAPGRLAELRSDDVAVAGRAAHTLKSNALAFGAVELAAVCRELEAAAREGEHDGSRGLIDRADAEWTRVNAELAELASR